MDLKDWIKEKGWSKLEFARRIGVHRNTVYLWITKKKPSKYSAMRIEKFTEGKVKVEDWNKENR